MAFKRSRHTSKSRAAEFLQQPNGVVHARVQKVGPEHFSSLVNCEQVHSLRDGLAAEIARCLLEHGARPNGKRGKVKRSPLAAAEGKPKL